MKIVSVGGGPAGLFFAILMKQLDPGHEITVVERNRPGDAFGWGVVFSDDTLAHFAAADGEVHRAITERFVYWSEMDVYVHGQKLRTAGHGFCGIARKSLLEVLQQRAARLGVKLVFESEVRGLADAGDADLVIAADGVNSRLREEGAARFKPAISWGRCRFSWLGTSLPLDAFTFIFKEGEHGLFQAHAYPFQQGLGTFIVECHEDVWKRAGLDTASEAETVRYLENLFRDDLKSHPLLTNNSVWRAFPVVSNAEWTSGNVVLMGDAAHTAHFSIGSGTKLAMEDAVSLAGAFRGAGGAGVAATLAAYEAERRPVVARFQAAARTSQEWFENSARHMALDPVRFTFSLLTRSKRVTYEALRERDPELVTAAAASFAGPDAAPTPPYLRPFSLGSLQLRNRMVVSPMCQYSSDDGMPDDWHLVHLGSRALGGAGLLITEATHVAADARISPACAGMYASGHVPAWKRIVEFVHGSTGARIGMQLSHAGRKGATDVPWRGGQPLQAGAWPLLAPSPLAYDAGWQVPRAMTRADMDRVRGEFVRAAEMADDAGFDMLELHLAHGYLLATFLSPLTNQRDDGYGGPVANRLRFPLEVLAAVRAAWPRHKPITARISATDWKPGGLDSADRVAIARALKEHGCDAVTVSSGSTVPDQQPVYGRMWNAGFSDEIRHEAGIPTLCVGNIQDTDQCNTLLVSGRADLCVLARAHLADPYLTLRAAAADGHDEGYWPVQYERGRSQKRRA
jgi:anthraniloyl-CoA monooxygenase